VLDSPSAPAIAFIREKIKRSNLSMEVTTMADQQCGEVTLGNVSFRTDPHDYEPLAWPRRYSVHRVIGGKNVIQDFGVNPKDAVLRLKSGQQCTLNRDTVAALDEMFRARGASYTLTDWLGNEFTVFMSHFHPRPSEPETFTYEMNLQVTGVVKLFGSPFQTA
jgi:hypothetical protein